jgi:signal peptidase I
VDPSVLLVKRVVAVPGDRLHLAGNRLFVNGVPQAEPFALYLPTLPDDFRDNFPNLRYADPAVHAAWWNQLRRAVDHGDLIVPSGHYFVLGDNRNDSEDSRYWGFVPRSAIVGQPLVVYFSLSQPTQGLTPMLPAKPTTPANHIADTLSRIARWDRIGTVLR